MDFIIDNFFEIWVGIMLLGILVEVGSIKNGLDADRALRRMNLDRERR